MPVAKGAQGSSICTHFLLPAPYQGNSGAQILPQDPMQGTTLLSCSLGWRELQHLVEVSRTLLGTSFLPIRSHLHITLGYQQPSCPSLHEPVTFPELPTAPGARALVPKAGVRGGRKASRHLPPNLLTAVTCCFYTMFEPCLSLPLKLQVFISPSLAVALPSVAKAPIHPWCQFDLRFTVQAPKFSSACEVLRENHSRKCLFPS